jgi:hypothetical protein
VTQEVAPRVAGFRVAVLSEGETYCAEQPPYGTFRETRGDNSADRRIARRDHRGFQPVIVDGSVRVEEGQG